MIDETTDKGRIIAAAMRLAAEKPWGDITLLDIAEAAGQRLVDLKVHFASKGAILSAFARAIDDDMLRRVPSRTEGQAARDAVFEVVMSRFDALAPYKRALRSIMRPGGAPPDPAMLRSFLASQHWMLQASGIDTGGPGGLARVAGLGSVYASVFRTWLDDEDPGHSRTMAALDRRLRSGERTLRVVDDALGFAGRVVGLVTSCGRGRRPRTDAVPDPAAQI